MDSPGYARRGVSLHGLYDELVVADVWELLADEGGIVVVGRDEDVVLGQDLHKPVVGLLQQRAARTEKVYGYIQMGEATSYADIYKVKAFTEKPDREFAQLFMESGEWLWNTGLFLANARYLRTTMEQYMPSVLRHLDEIYPHWTIDEENAYMQEHFRSYPNLSIDYGILEKSEHVCVARCQFGLEVAQLTLMLHEQ